MATTDLDATPSRLRCHLEGVSDQYFRQLTRELGQCVSDATLEDGRLDFISPGLADRFPAEEYCYLKQVSWDFYEATIEEFADRNLKITYLDGEMEIMSPLPEHEAYKRAMADLIIIATLRLRIPRKSFGSATFRSRPKKAGVEPDECFYFGEIASVAGMKRFDPKLHRAPDLVIEAEVFNSAVPRQPVYARLGVPEIWRYNGNALRILQLQSPQQYVERTSSRVLPMLPIAELAGFIKKMTDGDETNVLEAFEQWVLALPRSND